MIDKPKARTRPVRTVTHNGQTFMLRRSRQPLGWVIVDAVNGDVLSGAHARVTDAQAAARAIADSTTPSGRN